MIHQNRLTVMLLVSTTIVDCSDPNAVVSETCRRHCVNGAQDCTETDIDCGGGCSTCEVGKACERDSDCETSLCRHNTCQEPGCNDGILNRDESDIDCGGGSCPPCANTMACVADDDCQSRVCHEQTCDSASCTDGVQNAAETDIDCGGGDCLLCADNLGCLLGVDCNSGACASGVCEPASCERDGREISESFGAGGNPTGEPVGGGTGYSRQVANRDHIVRNMSELLTALALAGVGEVVYVEDDVEIDLSSEEGIEIPEGVTLASGRGHDGSLGAFLFSDDLGTSPLFVMAGPSARVTGLRLRGPDPERRESAYEAPNSSGIWVEADGGEVDNNEISAWSHVGVTVMATGAHVHHNLIHHCQRAGLGYGVSHPSGQSLIEANIFDWTRHAIAGSGRMDAAYEARYNLILENRSSSTFDMHGAHDFEKRITAANWRFDEGSGNNALDTSHSCKNDCVLTHMDSTAWVSGRINTGLYFDGVDDYLSCSYDACARYLTGPVSPTGTIAFWIEPAAIGSNNDLVNIFEDGYQNYLLIRLDSQGRVRVSIEDDDVNQLAVTTDANLSAGVSHYVAITQDGQGIRIFINGVEMATSGNNGSAWTEHLNLTGLWVGRGHWSYFNGVLDELRVYIEALSSEDIERQFEGHSDVAGRLVRIHHNTVLVADTDYFIVGIRGIPAEGCWIHHNWFSLASPSESIVQRHALGNMHVLQNWYGESPTTMCGWEGSE